MSCQHELFEAQVDVGRLGGDDGSPQHFVAEVHVWCAQCRQPFAFKGLTPGLSPTFPTVDVSGTEARMPLASPAEVALSPMPGMYGMLNAPDGRSAT